MRAAEKIKAICDKKGVKISFIANKAGMTADAVSKVFLGKRRLTADEMLAICDALEIDLCELKKSDESADGK